VALACTLRLTHQGARGAAARRYSAGAQANILWSAGVKDRCEVADVIARLEAANMPTLDISGMDAARVSHHPFLLVAALPPCIMQAQHARHVAHAD
jgi:hypothetical protein